MKSILSIGIFLFSSFWALAQNQAYISTNQALQDLGFLTTTFDQVHYNPYFKISKEQFIELKSALLQDWDSDSIPLKKFTAVGMKLAALLSGGHSGVDWQSAGIIPELKQHRYIPFTGKLVNNYTIFLVTKSNHPNIKPGMQIASINGINMVDLYTECMDYFGGIESFKNATCQKVFPLYLFFNDALQAPFTIKNYQKDVVVKTGGISINELMVLVNPAEGIADYTFEMMENNTGLISYNSCNNYQAFQDFLKETFKALDKNKVDKLIIDIRKNGGGDSGLNDLLLAYITKKPYRQSSGRYWKVSAQAKAAYAQEPLYERTFGKAFLEKYKAMPIQEIIEELDFENVNPETPPFYFNGKTCFLIGSQTFSSANFLADAVKTFQLSTLIGEPTGEYTNDFGEVLQFTLPNSGCHFYVSSTYDIGANGDPTLLEPVYPDIEIKTDVLNYAINWLQMETPTK